MRRILYGSVMVVATAGALSAQAQQPPWRGENLQFFPAKRWLAELTKQ